MITVEVVEKECDETWFVDEADAFYTGYISGLKAAMTMEIKQDAEGLIAEIEMELL